MTALEPSNDYSDLDFDALRVRIQNLIPSAFPAWTDFNVANFGNTLIDCFCFVTDVLTKYQNAAALNSRWSTSTSLAAVLASTKLIGYVPQGQTASQVEETFTLASGISPGDVVLPAGTTVQTLDVGAPVTYQLLAPLTIPAGTTSATGLVENSTAQMDVFDATGLLNQSVSLSQSPFLAGELTVTAGNGTYTQVANFLAAAATDLVYTLTTDANGVATLTFGNGVNGALPTGAITCSYNYGGGAAGVVGAGTLIKIPGSFTDVFGNPVQISVANAAASSPAQNSQSLASIQLLAPLSIRPAGRCIARTDYQDVALQVPGVTRALMLFATQDPSVAINQGVLRIVPASTVQASETLLTAVTNAFAATPYAQTLNLLIVSASYLVINVQVLAYKKSGVTPAQMKAGIVASLTYFFQLTYPATDLAGNPNNGQNGQPLAGTPNTAIDFGFNLKDENGNPANLVNWSDIFDAVRNAAGVRKIDAGPNGLLLNGVRADVAITLQQFPALGTITIIDGDTGQVVS